VLGRGSEHKLKLELLLLLYHLFLPQKFYCVWSLYMIYGALHVNCDLVGLFNVTLYSEFLSGNLVLKLKLPGGANSMDL